MSKLPWIGCELLEIDVDFESGDVFMFLHEGDCVDMTRAIDFAKKINSRSERIVTISGNEIDTCYRLSSSGEWGLVKVVASDGAPLAFHRVRSRLTPRSH